MPFLRREKDQTTLLSDLQIARSLGARLKGLLFTKSLDDHQGLWIHRCNSIHTFLMGYAIDCIFLDQEFRIQQLRSEVKPSRVLFPVWGANSVIETKAGNIQRWNLTIGEKLYVGT
ncbi:MAG: DUF192 domain-containing protein [Pseudobdellovibrionaceae bacterium]|jgi:uncharacterized membrane protein (UPF0127 family)